jgi:hypothetical protein
MSHGHNVIDIRCLRRLLSRATGSAYPLFVSILSMICPKAVLRKNEEVVLMRIDRSPFQHSEDLSL